MTTIGIDTNVLLAFRLQREPYSNEIKRLFQKCLENKAKIYIPTPVLLEVEWVLRSYYKQPKDNIIPFLDQLMLLDGVITDYKDEFKYALNIYRDSNQISFTDVIIMTIIKSRDFEFLTFDKALEKAYQSIM